MGIKLVHVKDDSEFYEVAQVERAAFESPVCRLMQLFFPLLGPPTDENVRDAAIAEAAERQITWHRSDPTSNWIKVIDEDTGEVLGASVWNIYESNPYAASSSDEHGCVWFPEGEDRKIADAVMGQFLAPRTTYMQRPHVFLNILFTAPSARRRGVGKLMMEWGTAQADKLGLVSYMDATTMGKELYPNFGFVRGPQREFLLPDLPRTDRYHDVTTQLLPFEWWPMFRPVNGKSEGAELPWDTQ